MRNSKLTELKLQNIVDGGKPKTIIIDGKKYYISKTMIENIKNQQEKKGGILPLLPIILGGLAAAGSLAGGTAGVVKAVNDKKAQDEAMKEERRHNKEIEKLAKGSSLYLQPPIGNGVKDAIKDFAKRSQLEEHGKRALKNVLYNLADSISVQKQGEGIYLSPYKK